MSEPTEAHIEAIGRALSRRRGFRQTLDEMTFLDDRDESEVPEDEDWTPEQREALKDFASAILNVQETENPE